MKEILTIGHSTYDLLFFVEILNKHCIDVIVDVRSVPYSKYSSKFNKENLKIYLKQKNIYYVYMGDLLGARYTDPDLLLENGKVDFNRVQKLKSFEKGINRLIAGTEKGFNISLMCSEKDAFDCHRFALISEFLTKNKIMNVKHIYPEKILTQNDLENRMIKKYNKMISNVDLFNPNVDKKQQIKEAYKFRKKDIAYCVNV